MRNDETVLPALGDAQHGTGGSEADVTWSAAQLARLESEWGTLRRAFAYHPHVTVTALRGEPPCEYQIDFRLTTLAIDESQTLNYVHGGSVNLWLPPGFPTHPPLIRPLTAIFHPNVSWDGFSLTSAWHPGETLLGLIRRIGELLAYRIYDPQSVVNPEAMAWLQANTQSLPIDAMADFTPGAGGDPLGRLTHFGPPTLESIRQSLLQIQESLLGSALPDVPAVREHAYRARMALGVFLESQVPEDLRKPAGALAEAAREMSGDLSMYEALRTRRAAAVALRRVAGTVLDAAAPLGLALDKLSGQCEVDPVDAQSALKAIPEAQALQTLRFSLPKLIDDGTRKLAVIRQQLEILDKTPAPPAAPSGTLLARRLARESDIVAAAVTAGRQKAKEAVAEFEPILRRARLDFAAFERVGRWREYLDMAARARDLERRVIQWGAAGVQAYFIENESGAFGPFQFEQPVDPGGGDVVVRSLGRGAIEVRNPAAEAVLTQGDQGTAKVSIPAPPSQSLPGTEAPAPQSFPTTFRLTERCDDLLVQFDFLRRQTAETLKQQFGEPGASEIWCGRFCRTLGTPQARESLEKELTKVAYRWRKIMMDLAALSPLKERLATYFLLQRSYDTIPAAAEELTQAKAGLRKSDQRLGEIAKRSSRDPDTNQLIVPPKYSTAYEQEMDFRDKSAATIKRTSTLIKLTAAQLMARLSDAKLLGNAEIPTMRALPALPEELAALPLADGQLGRMIVVIEELLNMPLGGPRPGPDPDPEPAPAPLMEPEAVMEPPAAVEMGAVAMSEGFAESDAAFTPDAGGGEVAEITRFAEVAETATNNKSAPGGEPTGYVETEIVEAQWEEIEHLDHSEVDHPADPMHSQATPLPQSLPEPESSFNAVPHSKPGSAAIEDAEQPAVEHEDHAAEQSALDVFVSDDGEQPAEEEWADVDLVFLDEPASPAAPEAGSHSTSPHDPKAQRANPPAK